jgi:hypothetical protein
MNNYYNPYTSPCSNNNLNNMYNSQIPCGNNNLSNYLDSCRQCVYLKDYGPKPYVVNIEEAANQNNNYRLSLWTGIHL